MASSTHTVKQQQHLPGFAAFLADQCLDEFVREVLRLSRETNIPILKYFTSFTDSELIELSKKSYIEIFDAIRNNDLQTYAEASLKRWSSNLLPQIERDQIVVEDITLSGYIRKNAFLKFIPRYTTDAFQIIELVKEIDEFVQILATGSFKMFITLLESRIQQHVEHFKQAQAITHIGNYVWDMSNRKLVWSDELYRIYGLNPGIDDISDSSFIATFNHPDDVSVVNTNIQDSLRTLKPFDFYYRIILKDESIKTLHARGEVIANSDGTALRILGTAQDVTEQVKAEEILHQRTRQLQQSNASLEEFAFVASHDLKEPLRKIAAFSDRFLYSYQDSIPAEGRQYLEKIMTSSNRMQAMVDDLLSLSMISSDRKTERVSLQRLMEEALVMLEHKIETTQAKIEIDPLPDWNVVPAQFRQLFQNLIGNSLKFLKKDTTPLIRVKNRILTGSEVTTPNSKKSNSYLELVFSDNGIGFAEEYKEKIFSVFQRLHHKEAFEGTGIGLAICKKIVENHAGFIKAEGTQDEGAIFKVIIPDETIQ